MEFTLSNYPNPSDDRFRPQIGELSSPSTSEVRFYDLEYRQQVARDILGKNEATQSIFFDDILNTVNPSQRAALHGIPGYMRCSLPAAELAAIAPAHVITLTPPFLGEIRFAEKYVEALGGNPANLNFWLYTPVDRGLLNLSALIREGANESIYRGLLHSIAESPPSAEDADHFAAAHLLIEKIKDHGRALVLPFQTRNLHQTEFAKEQELGLATLMSSSEHFIDKFSAAETLLKADPGVSDILLDPSCHQIVRETRADGQSEFYSSAAAIISEAQKKEARSGGSYIKLDGSGVSGIDNLSPERHPAIYAGDSVSRIAALSAHIEARFKEKNELPSAVIEERVITQRDGYGVKEYVVSGVTTGAGFQPWCIVRAINDRSDVYQGVIGSTNLSRIQITADERAQLIESMNRIAGAMNGAGYDFGYLSKDLMLDARSGGMKINDHNDRRGGRSFLERVLPLFKDQVLMDRDYEFAVPAGVSPVDHAMKMAVRAESMGHLVYGTCTSFYPTKSGNETFVKLKIVSEVPDDILDLGQDIVRAAAARIQTQIEGS